MNNPVNCQKWQAIEGSTHGGTCTLGLYGGSPSLGVCRNACRERLSFQPGEQEIASLASQAGNLAKAGGRAARALLTPGTRLLATQEVRESRQAVCSSCPLRVPAGKLIPADRCSSCGCVLAAKVRLATESCPEGKWAASTGTESFMRQITPDQLLERQASIREVLLDRHALVRALDTYHEESSKPGGCSSCKTKRDKAVLAAKAGNAIFSSSSADLQKMVDIFPRDVYFVRGSTAKTISELLEDSR